MSEMKKYKKWLLHEFRKLPCEVQGGHGKIKVVDILPLFDQLDEPEKVEPLVVPKELGEWLCCYDLGDERSLFTIIGNLRDMWTEGDSEEFIGNNKKKLIEVILGTRPYEVEKEKLYRVNMHGTDDLLLTFEGSGYYFEELLDYVGERPNIRQEFTESEIKAVDERYWPFAVEVVE